MLKLLRRIIVIFTIPLTFISALWLKLITGPGIGKINKKIFNYIGILPVNDHYYQPLICPEKHLTKSLRDNRILKGIDFNISEQISILKKFSYNDELEALPLYKPNSSEVQFYFNNGSYCSGDAEYLYNMIRLFKPSKIIEIGSGFSTLISAKAIEKNHTEKSECSCTQICIEPYEQPWLESKIKEIYREKVEKIDTGFFKQLNENDILFIDSSHIIRPQGDVLYEFLQILPELNKGVFIHIHDIFTPKDYLNEWIFDQHKLWNEQYLLEAFLSFNSDFKVIAALNYLSHNFTSEFKSVCPVFSKQPDREPGAFWIKKIK